MEYLVAMNPLRSCTCHHNFPICACCEGLGGERLRDRSRFLSSLAGWPAKIEHVLAVKVLGEYGRPVNGPDRPAAWPWPSIADGFPLTMIGEQVTPTVEAVDCGCGQGRA
jgi:hypothetical protein